MTFRKLNTTQKKIRPIRFIRRTYAYLYYIRFNTVLDGVCSVNFVTPTTRDRIPLPQSSSLLLLRLLFLLLLLLSLLLLPKHNKSYNIIHYYYYHNVFYCSVQTPHYKSKM